MQFLVAETVCYLIEAEDGLAAITARKRDEGICQPEHSSWRADKWQDDQQPMARDEWPLWAKALAKRETPDDKGIGDVIARTIGPEASGAFKAFYEMTFGRPCGCNGRQKLWNTKYPLNSKAT